ncbi:ABC transporter substrate-binding protein [Bordetella genomosp. 10]|uniref:ABC transporter substrate-binding protein n=1 Tax=Bordetella genomosp. 10 TaxID=1416804 RepID=A0A261SCJ0_9BORD|nr:tripartite tricarboxylate transporter substrate binding protein [Bordetella genomosp. 10]OZI34093.1 ABC transporter substrate-binding protein [Bordetella genomosp. 10]
MFKKVLKRLCAGLLAAGLASAAHAQPTGTVRYVVPAPPGGLIDNMARMVAQGIGDKLGRPIVIDNRPGGNTVIGADVVARSAPDGQTWLAVSIMLAANATLQPKMPFDIRKDLVPVARLAVTPMGVAVPANSPYHSLQELVNAAKGGKSLNYGSSGYGSPSHIGTALLEASAGFKANHIPYKGGMPALNDLMGGQLDFINVTISEAKPFIDSGKLRLLAVSSDKRLADYPNVPTTGEAGYQGAVMEGWTGVMVPGGTPAPVIRKIADAVLAAASKPEFVKRAESMGFVMAPQGPEAFNKQFYGEIDRLGHVIKTQNIKIE